MKRSAVHTGAPKVKLWAALWSPGRHSLSQEEPASGIQRHLVTTKNNGNIAGQLPELDAHLTQSLQHLSGSLPLPLPQRVPKRACGGPGSPGKPEPGQCHREYFHFPPFSEGSTPPSGTPSQKQNFCEAKNSFCRESG